MYARSSDARIEWGEVVEATFSIDQRFRYDYPGPIADLQHRLMVVPREFHGDQRRVASRLAVAPTAAVHEALDRFGNPVASVFARRVERHIEFDHRSLVTRTLGEHHVPAAMLEDEALLRPTALTACDATLRDAAKGLRSEHAQPLLLANAINAYVHANMHYLAATTVETSAVEAFTLRAGVCQDYAHVALALARRCGLAARYVSGHLLGEGGTHAWIEILVPDGAGARVLAYDPTHGSLVDLRYVIVAVGRDYADVAPTSGVFTAPYNGELTATKAVTVTHVRYTS